MNNFSLIKNKIVFEDKIEFTLSKNIIDEFGLKEKKYLSDSEYKEIIYKAAYNYSIYLLSKKDYFKKDIFQKLIEKYSNKEIMVKIIEELEEKEYVNDQNMLVQYVKNHEKYGNKKLEYELIRKGIKNSDIKKILSIDKDREMIEIERLLEKNKENL